MPSRLQRVASCSLRRSMKSNTGVKELAGRAHCAVAGMRSCVFGCASQAQEASSAEQYSYIDLKLLSPQVFKIQ